MPEGMLEYSEDPLSDATPTYVDVTSYVTGEVSWADGKTRDLDEPQAGGMSFRLRNKNREWEPEFSGAVFDLKPLRRFRWSIDGTSEMVGYVVSARVTWPTGSRTWSEVEVECVDGYELLSLDLLDFLDPPDATTYAEVVMFDQPFAYYRMNELGPGVLMAEAGPEGIYKTFATTTTAWRRSGLILGDPDGASVDFQGNSYARAPIGDERPFSEGNAFTVEAWCNVASGAVAAGPIRTAIADNIFSLTGAAGLEIYLSGGMQTIGTPSVGEHHLVGTWDGQTACLYIDGQLDAAEDYPGQTLQQENANDFVYVNHPSAGMNDNTDEVAFYTYALSPERILAHYQAGAERGFTDQKAGERIAAVADSTLWSEAGIDTGEHMVHAVMEHGQSKLEEIVAAVKAEMPDAVFSFDGDGNPVYRGWNYKDGLGPLATFGAGPGEHALQALEPVYDDEMFSTVVVAHQSGPGEETQHTATDAATEAAYFPRVHSETGLILSEHHDAIAVAEAILERHRAPMQRFANVTLNSADAGRWAQIQDRKIGDMIRVKGLSPSGTPIDVVTTILGRSKTYTPLGGSEGLVTCTWNCARGFAAGDGFWRLGIDGWSELGEVTVLG